MESILSGIADAPISASTKRRAYELIFKIVHNIVQAANGGDPNLSKYKWIKAQSGSALREKVLNVSPWFRELLKALGFTFRVGRPPHIRTGEPQGYVVFPDDGNLEDLATSVQILEAVIHSIPEELSPRAGSDRRDASPPSAGQSPHSDTSTQDRCPTTACSIPSRTTSSAATRVAGTDADLEELRREQQERYRQRGSGGATTARLSTEGHGSGPGTDDSRGSWFWHKFGWGGNDNNNNDDSSAQGRSTSSRRPPLNNRMMTLRDLPKPQRRG